MNKEEGDLLCGAAAIATFLGVPRRHALHLIESGRIPSFRIGEGRNLYARRSTLTAWLAQQETAALKARG